MEAPLGPGRQHTPLGSPTGRPTSILIVFSKLPLLSFLAGLPSEGAHPLGPSRSAKALVSGSAALLSWALASGSLGAHANDLTNLTSRPSRVPSTTSVTLHPYL